jgi:two-component system, LuxR family, sensor kinase FixL
VPADLAHQIAGPLLAAIVSIAGAANADRVRRKVFERDAKLDESEAHLLTLLTSMREAEARKGAIFESVPDAILTIDAAGKILELNSAAERTFGYPRNAAVGEELARLIVPPALRDRHRRALAHHAATGQGTILGKRVEMVGLRADGSEFPVELTVTRVRHDGPPMFTGCLRDVSERKAAEERAREQQSELAHVLRVATMGEMAAELAHELNQPLAAIVSFAKGLALRLGSGATPPAQLIEATDRIAAEALRAGEVMRRLRGFVRRSDPQRQPCDINAVVRDAAFLIEPDARRSDVAVRLVLAPDLPAMSMDRIQIQQVVLNLLRNGLEAIVEGGSGDGVENELLVETSLNSVGVEVTVRDTGVGLPPAAEQKIFGAFYTTKGNGLGLGLSIGKSILQEHGGRLWTTRNPYRGATFGFTLPVAQIAAVARRAG